MVDLMHQINGGPTCLGFGVVGRAANQMHTAVGCSRDGCTSHARMCHNMLLLMRYHFLSPVSKGMICKVCGCVRERCVYKNGHVCSCYA
jgi:hypothetical protein